MNPTSNREITTADLVVYNDGELELNIPINNETIWLNRNQISELLGRDVKTIGKHINNVFSDDELDKPSVVANFATTAADGKTYSIEYYNLDVVISVGYRVKSQRGVRFRQWATSVLKSYITDGYVINSEKITNQRFRELENDITVLKMKVENISNSLEDQSIKPKQHIFYDGQIFDAYLFVSELIKSAKMSIVLIDNYIDESVLVLFTKRKADVKTTLYTKQISKQLELDLKKHNAQYPTIEIKKFDLSHDRFLIVDEKDIYHFGASLKDLGKKWFAVSKMDIESFEILGKLK